MDGRVWVSLVDIILRITSLMYEYSFPLLREDSPISKKILLLHQNIFNKVV